MRLCHACLEEKPEDAFYKRKKNSINNRCIVCERTKKKVSLIFDKSYQYKLKLMEAEGERFFVCNIKYCSTHKKYHPLSFFGVRSDRLSGYRSACREVRKERKRAQRQHNKARYANIQQIICSRW